MGDLNEKCQHFIDWGGFHNSKTLNYYLSFQGLRDMIIIQEIQACLFVFPALISSVISFLRYLSSFHSTMQSHLRNIFFLTHNSVLRLSEHTTCWRVTYISLKRAAVINDQAQFNEYSKTLNISIKQNAKDKLGLQWNSASIKHPGEISIFSLTLVH